MKVTCLRGFNFDFPEYGEYSSSFFFSLYFVRCVLLANSLRCAFFFLQKNLWLNIQTERVTEREREKAREKRRERGNCSWLNNVPALYVYPGLQTPLFIALWQHPKVTAISKISGRFSSPRLVMAWDIQHTCEESSQSKFHFLPSGCLFILGLA